MSTDGELCFANFPAILVSRSFLCALNFLHTAGVPIKLLHEGEGHVITVELKNGEIYKGMLAEAEDTMNCQMKEGNARTHPQVYCAVFDSLSSSSPPPICT
jgi:hypothetical protein